MPIGRMLDVVQDSAGLLLGHQKKIATVTCKAT